MPQILLDKRSLEFLALMGSSVFMLRSWYLIAF